MLIDLLQRDPVQYLVIVVGAILSIVLHELGHAFAAIRQGDDTPRLLGHLTWNPVVHMGWLSLALVAIFGIGFGQTPVNPARFRSRRGEAIVSFAGPAVNLVLFLISATIFALWLRARADGGGGGGAGTPYALLFFFYLAVLNLVLLLFNLIPVPPLDGSAILANWSRPYAAFVRSPSNQPFVMAGLILVLILSGRFIWPFAVETVDRYTAFLVGVGR